MYRVRIVNQYVDAQRIKVARQSFTVVACYDEQVPYMGRRFGR